MDTIEDDMTINLESKILMLHNFHIYVYDPNWRFMESSGKDKKLLEDFPTISLEFRNLEKKYQVFILDFCGRIGAGMAEFLEKKIESLQDYEIYCNYAAAIFGVGLSCLFSDLELEDPIVGQDTQLSKSIWYFLQKLNVIRDFLEDERDERQFWPREVWSKYAENLSDLAKPENIDTAVHCMNDLITNALQHVPDILTFLSRLKNKNVFNFYAPVLVMGVGTVTACYNNKQVFRGIVKIRRGQAVTHIMNATNMQNVKANIYQYLEEEVTKKFMLNPLLQIYRKIPATDPSRKETQQVIISIRNQCFPGMALESRNNSLRVMASLSCAVVFVVLSWQYLFSV